MDEYDRSSEEIVGAADATHAADAAPATTDGNGLLDRIELIEAQPLSHRAQQFEHVHDELLAELQRGDHGAA